MRKKEEEEFQTGPLSVLTQAVKHNTQVESVYVRVVCSLTQLLFSLCRFSLTAVITGSYSPE